MGLLTKVCKNILPYYIVKKMQSYKAEKEKRTILKSVSEDIEYLEKQFSADEIDKLYETATDIDTLVKCNLEKIANIPADKLKSRYMLLLKKLQQYIPNEQKEQSDTTQKYSGWEMTPNEQTLFLKYVSSAEFFTEFGSGGSTVATLSSSQAIIYSVESSKFWVEYMRHKYTIIEKSEKENRLSYIYADIGNVGMWGIPEVSDKENNPEKYLNYSKRVFEQYPKMKEANVVLIDGRFRVACLLSALLETKDNTTFIFHDYWNRPEYHPIKIFVDYIDGVDTLMVCKKKAHASDKEIQEEYDKYKYDYR